jgi:hypothetical protein
VSGRREHGEVAIERISLRVRDMDPLAAEELARAVALGLAPALALAPGEASLPRLRVEVQAKRGERPDELAARAVARLAPLINRVSPAEAGR